MQITCLGATRTVTGSSFLVELDDQTCFLVDCGLFQGGRQIEQRNWDISDHRPQDIKAIYITHAHIDHSGLVPRLTRQGYNGPIYATKATSELLKILWLDSAHIQQMEAQWQSRKNKRVGRKDIEPLYETVDAEAAIALIRPVEMNAPLELIPGVTSTFVSAGHILGAASLHLSLQAADGAHNVGFSGDVGRQKQLIVPDPEIMPRVDTLFMETTYGQRLHKSIADSEKELMDVITQAFKEGGRVVIPSFAVERTQELIYVMAQAYRDGKWPGEMPVYLDSPLAIKATQIFRDHPEFFDDETKAILDSGQRPLNFPFLTPTPSTQESQAINDKKGPMVIIAGNGMSTAGRIKHHLKHNLWRSDCHVVIVGFQAQGSTGRQLVDGADTVKIFREDVEVRAKIHTIGGFSAHADQAELLTWLEPQIHDGLCVNLIHGEELQSLGFAKVAQKRFPNAHFHVPKWKEVIRVTPFAEVAPLPVEEFPEPAARLAMPQRRAMVAEVRQLRDRLDEVMLEILTGERDLDQRQIEALRQVVEGAEAALAQWEAA
ncbi:RNA-metabolising metallo-beta-lactamase [Desulfarculus baarsii DSM 2075]|uniref:RNA-metabolising metallo-beta-lactamase n=1 Tax=Desulfarculus baarsii (strain ATCC 33931 / DSM 2075 / LMG 7858 / VKM B-1802 / 2st14) TaxID=644282 RepID=E1QL44_DESB2|nr:MBL fold/beta-CASP domain-containing RNA metallo-hydrolase [Desulfarculus baarsii]ADK85309.1 RNA-metabolising metallo-beta-lactamase [Desulfarculus baarsii DSM 2075]